MNQSQINFNAKLVDNEIVIKLTSDNGDRDLENEAASQLFSSLEKVGIEVVRTKLQQDWHNND